MHSARLEKSNDQTEPHADEHCKRRSVIGKSALATAAFAGLILAGTFYSSGNPLFAAYSGDNVSDSNQRSRIEAFNALECLRLSRVTAEDIPVAIETMHLALAGQEQVRSEIAQTSDTPSPTDAHARSYSLRKGVLALEVRTS